MVTPPQRWALALGAVLTELNQGFHHELGGWGSGEHTAGWCRSALANSWGVTDEASFRATTEWLWAEGHGIEIMAILAGLGPDPRKDNEKEALVRANRALLAGKGLLAWDLGRYVAVVGWGRWAGFVSEPEAWRMIHGAAVRVQAAFKSWREFGRHYEFGRYYWSGQDDARCEAVIAKLTKDPASPWVQIEWKLPLGAAPVVEAAPVVKPPVVEIFAFEIPSEEDVERLLADTGLDGDHDVLPLEHPSIRHCGGCGSDIPVVPGATRVVCEACGHRVEVGVAEIACGQCARTFSFPVGKDPVACPSCAAMVVRV